jgi:hypothetical protein
MRFKEITKLLHLSFNPDLEGVWTPKLPDGGVAESTESEKFSEPDIPRISVAPSIKQCFWAIYPNISHLIDTKSNEEWHDEIYFCVYEPNYSEIKSLVEPETITKNKWVHDAHMTEEYWILNPVYMRKIKEIYVKNPSRTEYQKYRPFNDPLISEREIGPKLLKYRVI